MRLWHVSERCDIELFEPRVPPNQDSGVTLPVVWAVEDLRLPNYLVPRECPRVAFHCTDSTTIQDRQHFFGSNHNGYVVAVEKAWLPAIKSTELWLYQLPIASFKCIDANAGYFVSEKAVRPIGKHGFTCPVHELTRRGVELRAVSSLRKLQSEVVKSSVGFSCIRMRNASFETH